MHHFLFDLPPFLPFCCSTSVSPCLSRTDTHAFTHKDTYLSVRLTQSITHTVLPFTPPLVSSSVPSHPLVLFLLLLSLLVSRRLLSQVQHKKKAAHNLMGALQKHQLILPLFVLLAQTKEYVSSLPFPRHSSLTSRSLFVSCAVSFSLYLPTPSFLRPVGTTKESASSFLFFVIFFLLCLCQLSH